MKRKRGRPLSAGKKIVSCMASLSLIVGLLPAVSIAVPSAAFADEIVGSQVAVCDDCVNYDSLPGDYQGIEYAQWPGTNQETYIDTGVIPTNHSVEMVVSDPSYNVDEHWFGTEASARYYHFTVYNGKYYWGQNGVESSNGSWTTGTHFLQYNVDLGNRTNAVVLDGSVLGSGTTITSRQNLLIGARKHGEYTTNDMKVFSLRVTNKETGEVVKDFVPCKRKSDGVVGFYDLVGKQFFSPAAGELVAGNNAVGRVKIVDFDGESHGINVTAPEGCVVEYSVDNTAWSSEVPTYSEVGDYPVWYRYWLNGSEEWITVSCALRIASCSASVPTAIQGLIYNGSMQQGVLGNAKCTLTGNSALEAGSYTAVATLKSTQITWNDGTTEPKNIVWSIAKATIDISAVSFRNVRVTYDGNPHAIDEPSNVPEGVECSGITYVDAAGNVVENPTEVGIYTATASFTVEDANNYCEVSPMVAKLTISKEKINTVSGDQSVTFSQCYDGVLASALVYGDTSLAVGSAEGSQPKVMLLSGDSMLPEGYNALEYVQWPGSQQAFVNTGVIPADGDYATIMTVCEPNWCKDAHWFGTQAGARYYHFTPYENGGIRSYYFAIPGVGETHEGVWSNTSAHTVVYNWGEDHQALLDGSLLYTGGSEKVASNAGEALLVGTRDRYVTTDMQVYSFKVVDNGTGKVVRNLVPAKNSEGVVGFVNTAYNEGDSSTGEQFYAPQTGSLIAGAEAQVIDANVKLNGFDLDGDEWRDTLDLVTGTVIRHVGVISSYDDERDAAIIATTQWKASSYYGGKPADGASVVYALNGVVTESVEPQVISAS